VSEPQAPPSPGGITVSEPQAPKPPTSAPSAKKLVNGLVIWVVLFAIVLLAFLSWEVKVPANATVGDQLALVVTCVVLLIVSCIAFMVLAKMAMDEIDLSNLLSESGGGGASLSRFQFLIFTFVIALGLFLIIAHTYKFPDTIPDGVLTLLGISASTYAVGKGITATDPTGMAKKPKTPEGK
jgi:hypothetical protein